MINVCAPDYYSSFSCLGSECPDTCCVGWLIEIDPQSYERFQNLKGELGEKVRANIFISDEGKPCFKLNENGRCAFLNSSNLCQMYIDCGQDSLCALCDNYPRIGEEFGSIRELGLSISCPEVARIILEHKEPISFEMWEQDEKVDSEDYSEDPVFQILTEIRASLIALFQDKSYTVKEKLSVFIVVANWLQATMDDNNYDEIVSIADRIQDNSQVSNILASVKATCKNKTGNERIAALKAFYEEYLKLDIINASFDALIKDNMNNLDRKCDKEAYVIENLLVYYCLRYFMKVIFDGDILSKAIFAIMSILVLNNSNADLVTFVYQYSKEIEHCEPNMEALADLFWDLDEFGIENLLKAID